MTSNPVLPESKLVEIMQLQIRAINGDNKSEIVSLVSLFTRCLGDAFPVSGIYDPRFLKACLSSRFVSLVALVEGKAIAHLAYTSKSSERVKILLPLIDPDFLDLKEDVEKAFLEILNNQKASNNWKVVQIDELDSPFILQLGQTTRTKTKPSHASFKNGSTSNGRAGHATIR